MNPESERDVVEQLKEFGIEDVENIEKIASGSTSSYKIVTSNNIFFCKLIEMEITDIRSFEFNYYVTEHLIHSNVKQPTVYRTKTGNFKSSKNYMLFDFIEGKSDNIIPEHCMKTVITYMAKYNIALSDLETPTWVLEHSNHWDRADSLDYLMVEFFPNIDDKPIHEETIKILKDAWIILNKHLDKLNGLPKQLVHGDLNGENIIYTNNCSDSPVIIDLTPYFENHVYSLCVSLYWMYIYFSKDYIFEFEKIKNAIAVYNKSYEISKEEQNMIFPMFVKLAVRMVVVVILFDLDSKKLRQSHPQSHTEVLKVIMENEEKIKKLF